MKLKIVTCPKCGKRDIVEDMFDNAYNCVCGEHLVYVRAVFYDIEEDLLADFVEKNGTKEK